MAFNSIVEGAQRMNAKMIAMGQSTDIQKMPRPRPGTQAAQKRTQFVPEGTELEKMLYPKNFKPRTFEADEVKIVENKIQETPAEPEAMETIQVEQKQAPRIIGDDDTPPSLSQTQVSGSNSEPNAKPFQKNAWESCKHYKASGNKAFCKEYLGWCAQGKCQRPKY